MSCPSSFDSESVSLANIVSKLLRDNLAPVVIALTIAVPLAYVGMDRWLNNFAYPIDIQYGSILLTAIILIVLAGMTVSYQSARAAMRSPGESLRSE